MRYLRPSDALPGGSRLIWFKPGFWRLCIQRMREHDVFAMAAALTYQTIFAMIPVLILALLVAKSVGTLEDGKRSLRTFLEASGFAQIVAAREDEETGGQSPATAPTKPRKVINVADEIERIVERVEGKLTFTRIGPVGGLLFIWTALSLMSSIERSLGRVLEAERSRALVRRMLLYWSVVTLGPVLLGVVTFAGRKGAEVFHQTPWIAWLISFLGQVGPFTVGVMILAALYWFLPGTRVRFSAAFIGAAVAVLLWSAAKWGFAVYVERLVLTGSLYGVLGVLPLFLLWLYYSWLAVLFGAELAYAGSSPDATGSASTAPSRLALGPSDFLAVAVAIAHAYRTGCGPICLDELAATLRMPIRSTQHALDRLKAGGVVCLVPGLHGASYVLMRPPELVSVLEVIDVADPRGSVLRNGSQDTLREAVSRLRERMEESLGELTLADLLSVGHPPPMRSSTCGQAPP